MFAWNGAETRNSKDTELDSKESKHFEQVPYIKKKSNCTFNEFKMTHPQLIPCDFQFQSLLVIMNSKNPNS